MSRYPTLDLIDALRPNNRKLAEVNSAAMLEREANRLVSDRWSDTVWVTGRVSATAFATVVDHLDRLA